MGKNIALLPPVAGQIFRDAMAREEDNQAVLFFRAPDQDRVADPLNIAFRGLLIEQNGDPLFSEALTAQGGLDRIGIVHRVVEIGNGRTLVLVNPDHQRPRVRAYALPLNLHLGGNQRNGARSGRCAGYNHQQEQKAELQTKWPPHNPTSQPNRDKRKPKSPKTFYCLQIR